MTHHPSAVPAVKKPHDPFKKVTLYPLAAFEDTQPQIEAVTAPQPKIILVCPTCQGQLWVQEYVEHAACQGKGCNYSLCKGGKIYMKRLSPCPTCCNPQ